MNGDEKYWFPAKRYGWGWGLPATWQGWAVLALFAALLVPGVVFFVGPWLIAWCTLLVAGLVLICYRKGEPPRWRWGGR